MRSRRALCVRSFSGWSGPRVSVTVDTVLVRVVPQQLPNIGRTWTRCLGMQRGSEVWVWTGRDTAFERGKVERLEAHKGVVHVTLAGGKAVESKDGKVHLTNSTNQDGVADNTELRQLNEAPQGQRASHPGPCPCLCLLGPRRLWWLATPIEWEVPALLGAQPSLRVLETTPPAAPSIRTAFGHTGGDSTPQHPVSLPLSPFLSQLSFPAAFLQPSLPSPLAPPHVHGAVGRRLD